VSLAHWPLSIPSFPFSLFSTLPPSSSHLIVPLTHNLTSVSICCPSILHTDPRLF
jgi:hypothetical protein